jgi:hypothetical protein
MSMGNIVVQSWLWMVIAQVARVLGESSWGWVDEGFDF